MNDECVCVCVCGVISVIQAEWFQVEMKQSTGRFFAVEKASLVLMIGDQVVHEVMLLVQVTWAPSGAWADHNTGGTQSGSEGTDVSRLSLELKRSFECRWKHLQHHFSRLFYFNQCHLSHQIICKCWDSFEENYDEVLPTIRNKLWRHGCVCSRHRKD